MIEDHAVVRVALNATTLHLVVMIHSIYLCVSRNSDMFQYIVD